MTPLVLSKGAHRTVIRLLLNETQTHGGVVEPRRFRGLTLRGSRTRSMGLLLVIPSHCFVTTPLMILREQGIGPRPDS